MPHSSNIPYCRNLRCFCGSRNIFPCLSYSKGRSKISLKQARKFRERLGSHIAQRKFVRLPTELRQMILFEVLMPETLLADLSNSWAHICKLGWAETVRRVSLARIGEDVLELAYKLIEAFPEVTGDVSYVISKRRQKLHEWEAVIVPRVTAKYEELMRETVDEILATRYPWVDWMEGNIKILYAWEVECAEKWATSMVKACLVNIVGATRGVWEPYSASASCTIGRLSGYNVTRCYKRFGKDGRPEVMTWLMHGCNVHATGETTTICENAYLQDRCNEKKELEWESCWQLANCYPID